MAFFGLLLFLTCVLLPYLKLDDNEGKINEIKRNLLVLNHERDALVNDIKLVEDANPVSLNDSASVIHVDAGTYRIQEIKKGIDLRTEQINLENQILEEMNAAQDKIVLFMGYFIIFSFLFVLFGFLLWYFKLQRPSNKSIKIDFLRKISED